MSSTPRLRCAVYTRKSSEEGLDQEFNSLDAQREACVAYIASQVDASGVSFVSVTQAFNTTSSMGRLTLNVLLSFAQFEREVTAERIRDKIAASRKKGMWMGGRVPFGYEVRDRKLVINHKDAQNVRHIFHRYLHLKSVLALTEEVNRTRVKRSGETDAPDWTRGKLYYLLANQIYVGKVRHHDRHFEGDHEAIVEAQLFDEVQTLLAVQAPRRTKSPSNAADLHLLTGILYDETGDRMSPAHASNHGKRYRYYVSGRLKTARAKDGWRVPAGELETIIDQQIRLLLRDRARLASWIDPKSDAGKIQGILEAAAAWLARFSSDDARIFIREIVRRLTLHPDRIEMQIDTERLVAVLGKDGTEPGPTGRNSNGSGEPHQLSITVISTPIIIKRRGIETRRVIDSEAASSRSPEPKLIEAIGRAHLYLTRLTDGAERSVADVADLCGVHSADVSRMLPLAFLAPKIVEKIFNGTQPADLTIRKLTRASHLPLRWDAQEELLLA